MPTATVRVSNLSASATEQDIVEFFSFSGDIQRLDLNREGSGSQIAYVTFRDCEALETALRLDGAKIVNQCVTIVPVEVHVESQEADEHVEVTLTLEKAKAVIANVLAKGYILGKDAMDMARAFDEKHQLSAQATTVSSFNEKVGICETVNVGSRYLHIKSWHESHGQKVSGLGEDQTSTICSRTLQSAGSALMKNQYIFTGATWLTGALSEVAKVVNDVSQKTKEKVQISELERREQVADHSFGSASHLGLFADHIEEHDMGHYRSLPDAIPASLRSEVQY
ncbi:hypothetical protein O6H91_08G053000 [Diphasiastrum complanatum]|uniref:Uncharacterized protein n=1 Tax=Diphasiastrum complanatum TaxID=34168 RepID=A0ACC2CXQ1_DIPCM|nr:hypothetical protein O6H91_08G053000 [Diphasiastrum complanatum]